MRLLTFDELTPSMEVDRTLLHLAAFGGVFPRRAIGLWRQRARLLADYVGVFAAEDGRVVGQVLVLRFPYAFREGTETISGLAGVATRPDRGRGGIARALIEEVHRRERAAGIRFISLWTNRSWGAHRLYEKLGYQDVYSSPWAVHAGDASKRVRSAGRRVRPGTAKDLSDVERLHAREAEGRLGFCRGEFGYLRTWMRAGDLDPRKELLVAREAGSLVGYAHVERSPSRVVCGEMVASSLAVRRALVDAVRIGAKGTPYAFQHTPVTDAPQLFQAPPYSRSTSAWLGFMGCTLGRRWRKPDAVRQFVTDDPRFLCLAGDRF
jgi:predicted N-acetyltransferase YhbS